MWQRVSILESFMWSYEISFREFVGSDSWIVDSQSDTETGGLRRRQRSRRTRYKNTSTLTASSSFTFANASSSISGIEEEQEQVALCLMMLSRDVGSWGGLNSVTTDSSENDSVVVEIRSSILVTKTCNADQIVKKKKKSNFGFSPNGFKNTEGDEQDGFEVCNVELGKIKNRVKCREAQAVDQTDSESGKYNSSKRTLGEASESIMGEDYSWKKMKCGAKSKYECTACNKTFHSYQALGGHRASHKKARGCCASKIETSETSIDNNNGSPDSKIESKLMKSCSTESLIETSSVEATKKKKHECPVCYKVFASGQALGGHKRSHVLEASNQTILNQQKLPEIRDFLDLNLPRIYRESLNQSLTMFFTRRYKDLYGRGMRLRLVDVSLSIWVHKHKLLELHSTTIWRFFMSFATLVLSFLVP